MWEWLMKELYNAVRVVGLNDKIIFAEEDDVVNETLGHLLQHRDTAEAIYAKRNKAHLIKIMKGIIYEIEGKAHCKNGADFAGWQKINDICHKYSITPYPHNAYKIKALLDYEKVKSPYLSISRIENLLKNKKMPVVFLNPQNVEVFENGVKI